MRKTKKITKVLIANRGEIAVRILRTLHEMGIKAAIVYSEADRDSLAVRLADEAVFIGPAQATESYLSIPKIISAAKKIGADALHPGYGFLAENPELVKACEKNGITFIGPSVSTMHIMGDKLLAKECVRKTGVPLLPGSIEKISSIDAGQQLAREIGYPIIIKAALGGGGRGLRIVRSELEMENSFYTAQMEARTAFGDDALFLEKYIDEARHIEFQILGDGSGGAIHLYERECTIQRRHQKLLEEAPSPFIDEKLRAEMGEAAIEVARSTEYEGAGTVEFLCDTDRNFYFIEMNTRIQVEHPVTEAICNIDLVRKQIEIAREGKLNIEQDDIRPSGWAIECRINAEDPMRDFLPTPGKLGFIHLPYGQGVRVDSHIFAGYTIPRHYDSLMAKVVAHGEDRPSAIAKMKRALDELAVEGVATTALFHRRLLSDPEFVQGLFSTNYIEKNLKRLTRPELSETEIGAIASALEVYLMTRHRMPQLSTEDILNEGSNPWKVAGRKQAMQGLGGNGNLK